MLLGLGRLFKQCLGKCSVNTGSPLNPLHIWHRCRGFHKLIYPVQMRNTCSGFATCGSWRVLDLWSFRIVTFACLLISTFDSARERGPWWSWCSMLQPGRSFSSSSTLPCPDLSARETSWKHVCSQNLVNAASAREAPERALTLTAFMGSVLDGKNDHLCTTPSSQHFALEKNIFIWLPGATWRRGPGWTKGRGSWLGLRGIFLNVTTAAGATSSYLRILACRIGCWPWTEASSAAESEAKAAAQRRAKSYNRLNVGGLLKQPPPAFLWKKVRWLSVLRVFVVTICRNLLPGLNHAFVRQRSGSQTTAIQRNCSGHLSCGNRLDLNFWHCMAGHFCLRTVTVCFHSRSNIWRSMLVSGESNALFCPYLSRNHWTDINMFAFKACSAVSYLNNF